MLVERADVHRIKHHLITRKTTNNLWHNSNKKIDNTVSKL